jgi:hypothetical protein
MRPAVIINALILALFFYGAMYLCALILRIFIG